MEHVSTTLVESELEYAVVAAQPAETSKVEAPTPTAAAPKQKGRKTLPILAGVAVVSLGAGFALSSLVVNPAEVAARTAPPEAGLLTVPVENRPLNNDVNIRGDVVFDGATSISVETAEMTTRAIVTGMVPEVGQELGAGDVALEIAGRPVILLPGGLPTYRSLRVGTSGPDVIQLREALDYMGLDGGDLRNDTFDAALAASVAQMYQRIGFDPPAASEGAQANLNAAQQAVTFAQQGVTQAQNALAEAQSGPDSVSVASADAAVRSAERFHSEMVEALYRHRQECAPDPTQPGCESETSFVHAVDNAWDSVGIARASRQALNVTPDLTPFRQAVTSAQSALSDAQAALVEAQQGVLTYLPASEVIFLETLPRRVDFVNVARGETVGASPIMSVSGADLTVQASAANADAALISVGDTGFIEHEGEQIQVTIAELTAPEAGGGRWDVRFSIDEITNEQVAALRGRNVRITIPVDSTDGDVLTVPLAALTAGPGGETRVELKQDDGSTELVLINTGLAAGGHVEIEGIDRELSVGDLVVIGQGAATGNADQ